MGSRGLNIGISHEGNSPQLDHLVDHVLGLFVGLLDGGYLMTRLVAQPDRWTCVRCGAVLRGLQASWVAENTGTVADLGVRSEVARVPVCAGGCERTSTHHH